MLSKKRSMMAVLFLAVFALFSQGCSSGPDYEEFIRGPWRLRVASIHTILNFRANGSWTEKKKVEKEFSRIERIKGQVDGEWRIEKSPDDENISFLVMTPTLVDTEESLWIKDEPVYLEIVDVNSDVLIVRGIDGIDNTWNRLKSDKEQAEGEDSGLVKISMGPVIVNLTKERKHQKDRYLCLDLELALEDIDGIDFVHGTVPDETGAVTYTLHPRVREAALLYLSSLTYRDVKTLAKVKGIAEELRIILNPYFVNKLTELTVGKVIVTANVENVEDFENQYKAQVEAEKAKAKT